MFKRSAATAPFPTPLCLDSGQRILTPQGEAILGWMGEGSEGVAQLLTIPDRLLAPCPTASVVYSCNLPAALEDSPLGVLDVSGRLPNEIGRDLDDDFLAGSLPGGQAAIITDQRRADRHSVPLGVPHGTLLHWSRVAMLRARGFPLPWRLLARDRT